MKWGPKEVIIVGLGLSLAIALIVTSFVPIFSDVGFTDKRAMLIHSSVMAIITIVAGYVLGNKDK